MRTPAATFWGHCLRSADCGGFSVAPALCAGSQLAQTASHLLRTRVDCKSRHAAGLGDEGARSDSTQSEAGTSQPEDERPPPPAYTALQVRRLRFHPPPPVPRCPRRFVPHSRGADSKV